MTDSSIIVKNKAIVVLSAVLFGVVALLWYGVQKQPYSEASSQAGQDPQLAAVQPAAAVSGDTRLSDALLRANGVSDLSLPRFDIVRLSRGGSGVVAGRALPGQKVSIMRDDEILASTMADADGQWVSILQKPLPTGSSALGLKAIDRYGVSRLSENVVAVSIPASTAEVGDAPAKDDVIAVLTPKSGGRSRILQRPLPADGANGAAVSIDTIDVLPSGQAIYSGAAKSGQKVRLYIDDKFLSETEADKANIWSVTAPVAVLDNPQDFVIRIDQIAEDGRVDMRVEQKAGLAQDLHVLPEERPLVIESKDKLWAMARWVQDSAKRSATYYSYVFDAGANRIANPDAVFPGQVFSLPLERSKF